MTIKSDRWIRRMAEEHGMIEPFEPNLISTLEGRRVISFGTSSYGYDVRCADEFKVFTNINSTIVDPKDFDPASFVDVKSDVCIIPPNSFALARTVEYFRIPRNVLTICMGKSTYARCFSADTRVALADGTCPTLEEMARRYDAGEMFFGYAIGPHGKIIVTHLESPRFVGRDKLIEITLDNGAVIHCTPDHRFMTREGEMVKAEQLQPGARLMPLYRRLFRGYEMVYQPLTGHYYPTHRLADEWNLRHGIYADEAETHRHHIDHNRRNNNPWNLIRLDRSEHIRLHNRISYGLGFDTAEHSASIRAALRRLQQNPQWMAHYRQVQSQRAQSFWRDDRYAQTRMELIAKHREYWSDPAARQAQAEMQRRFWEDNAAARERQSERSRTAWANSSEARRQQQREIARNLNIRREITAEAVRAALDAAGSIRGAARLLNCDRSVFRRFPEVIHAFRGTRYRNHRIESVRRLRGEHDVYCLTVPEAGNFALEAGVFVSNCGVIVNITPLEPEWEGHVTLEFSNTTPLPAKIYAHEGVAQMIFLESDEACETSYADRGGKYQGQTGVTLPKA
ncbi:hypothetical protein MIT9_P2350 [Methylomarinovum caldicuralii]|uniref:dCTP deaminase n=1 Tax=Methylomarinovum caldicuralii TaxID=438856 RepID=A0AAU9C6F8_9GAMM|nr:hypothetical protein MIT9_P2350 [Methylomarinovum caldicuralii]